MGSAGEGAAELHPFLETEREAPGRSGPDLGDVEEVDDLLRPPPVLDLLAAGRAPEDAAFEHPALHQHAAAEEDVVEHRHPGKEGDVLEGAGDAVPGDFERPSAGDVRAVEQHAAAVGRVDPAHHVDEGGLPGPVRSDDRENFLRLGGQGRFAQRQHAAERLRGIDDFKTIAHPLRPDQRDNAARRETPGGGRFVSCFEWWVKRDSGSNVLSRAPARPPAAPASFRRVPECIPGTERGRRDGTLLTPGVQLELQPTPGISHRLSHEPRESRGVFASCSPSVAKTCERTNRPDESGRQESNPIRK